jgi:hypothetical protein
MYTGICPAGSNQDDVISRDVPKSGLNFALNGSIRGLALPTMISAAIVFNGNFKIWHEKFGLEPVARYIPKLAFEKFIHRIDEFVERIFGVT